MSQDSHDPNFAQWNLEIFANPSGARTLFQPRIDFWINTNRAQGTLPEIYRDLDNLEIYDDLGCSVRPYKQFTPCLITREFVHSRVVEEFNSDRTHSVTRWITPVGDVELWTTYGANSFHFDRYPVCHPDDFKILDYLLRDQVYRFDMEKYALAKGKVNSRGAPQIIIPRVNIMRMMINWMGMEATMMALMQYRQEMEKLLRTIDETEPQMLQTLAESPIPIINYGDNWDCFMITPEYVERYIQPAYERRTKYLSAAGKYVTCHMDGRLRTLLPFWKALALDGIEAPTPLPQGDVTLQEMRDAMPRQMVLLDGIPMLAFLPGTPFSLLEECVSELVELFEPKLVLGISDELSPVCDIERVRYVAQRIGATVPFTL